MSPPVAYATPVRPAGNWDGGKDRDRLIVAASTVLANVGYDMRPARVRRAVQAYERRRASGFTFFDFLANYVQLDADQRRRARMDPEMASVIEYADRTGESAVNNVIRERGY